MAILIAGNIDFDPAFVSQMIVSAAPLIRAALDEEGCVAYAWSLDPLQPGRVRVFEEWTDESALARHFSGGPYRDMGAHLRAAGMMGFAVNKYRSDLCEPVYDDKGEARADFFT
jgi:quinol monooxygenase YgiN